MIGQGILRRAGRFFLFETRGALILLGDWCGPESDPPKSSLANRNPKPISAEIFERLMNFGLGVPENAYDRHRLRHGIVRE
jgi:hypothetical protein